MCMLSNKEVFYKRKTSVFLCTAGRRLVMLSTIFLFGRNGNDGFPVLFPALICGICAG